MSYQGELPSRQALGGLAQPRGCFWLALSVVAAGMFFREGIEALLVAWQLPEYSHGPADPGPLGASVPAPAEGGAGP